MTTGEMHGEAAARLAPIMRAPAEFDLLGGPSDRSEPVGDSVHFQADPVVPPLDDPRKLPRDAVRPADRDERHDDEPEPGVLRMALLAASIVLAAGAFGATISWAMSHVPHDQPHYAYHPEPRIR